MTAHAKASLEVHLDEQQIGGLTVKIVPPGGIVPGAGVYKMPMSVYHSQRAFPGPSVSSTGIREAVLQSPHAFWKRWDGNPDRYPPKEESDALILGKATHAVILGDEVFDEHFIYVPEDAPPRPTAPQIKAYERDGVWSDSAAPRAEFWIPFDERAAGRHMLKHEQVETIFRMAENLQANPLAREMLVSDLIEISMVWQDEQTGLWVKSRPDCIPSNGYDFGDLKTFSPKGTDLRLAVQRATTDRGYHMQMALAIEGVEQVLGTTAERCGLVFTQTTEPWECLPVLIDEDTLYWARVLNRHGLNLIGRGLETGDWPGVGADLITYSLPPSMTHRLSEMQAAGELPNL